MRQVIFVGGTSRSGSTLLNLMLANHPDGLGLGEIHASFHPIWKHHNRVRKSLAEKRDIWHDIIEGGSDHLYLLIRKHFPEYGYMVDSSKQIFWIRTQNRNCGKTGFQTKNVLIFKSPHEIAQSFLKRGLDWTGSYVRYHRKYASLVDEAYIVSYKGLVTDPETLKGVCDYCQIPYRDDMINYWEGKDNVFFGSQTPKKVTEIRYDAPDHPGLTDHVQQAVQKDPQIHMVYEILNAHRNRTVDFRSEAFGPLRLNPIILALMQIRYHAHIVFRRLFPKTPGPGI